MAVVYATSNAAGVATATTGSFTADGTITEVVLGFTPKWVKVVNVTDVITMEKMEGMAANAVINTVTAGTTTINTSSLITFADNGFSVAIAAAGSGDVVAWVAM